MSLIIQLFAAPKEIIGSSSLSIEWLYLSTYLSSPTVSSSSFSISEGRTITPTTVDNPPLSLTFNLQRLRDIIITKYPSLSTILPSCRFAIDQSFVDNEDTCLLTVSIINPGSLLVSLLTSSTSTTPRSPSTATTTVAVVQEIALIPPVSGG